MRVLLSIEPSENSTVLMEIMSIEYCDDLLGCKEEVELNAEDFFKKELMASSSLDALRKKVVLEGLLMMDPEGDSMYIPGISKDVCDTIIQDLLVKGYADLQGYGRYYYEADAWSYLARYEKLPSAALPGDSLSLVE